MKTKLNLLILLALSIVLLSCGTNIPTRDIIEHPYVVVSITTNNKYLCKYDITTGVDYLKYRDDLTVIDSVGKFVVGDTIYLSLNKN